MIIKRDQQAAQESVEQSTERYTQNWKKVQTGAGDDISAAEQVLKSQSQSGTMASVSATADSQAKASPEMYAQFAQLSREKKEERRKQVLTLRVSPQTMAKAKALGKGYTGVCSRLLDMAIDDPEMVKKCL
ncbi:MAG: hypothetical protein VZR02_05930 [Lachnospiraceae bacterium]|nr:hypothetical protein [Lachnospiraceae bacterium]